MLPRPTLIVHTTYFPLADRPEREDPADPERENARSLGEDLYALLTRPNDDPLAWGAGVPVRVATRYDQLALDEAEHVIVLPVLGQRSHAREDVRTTVLSEIGRWAGRSGVHVFPVLATESWRGSEGAMAVKPLLTQLYGPGDRRLGTLQEIVLALARVMSGRDSLNTRLFVSHAKADLARTGQAAELIHNHVVTSTTGQAFFDKVSLLPGENLAEQIDAGASRGVFVIVRGDTYSSRSWCQRELLTAKRARMPTLTVEVLSRGERRSLPYGGNCPTVVWDRTEGANPAAQVALLAMVESVRHTLFLTEACRIAESADLDGHAVVAMSRPPELLDLPALRSGTRTPVSGTVVVMHPDPELSVAEHDVLAEADRHLRLLTPTTALAGALGGRLCTPLDGWKVAMSLSDSPDAGGPQGYTQEHVRDATIFLSRALVASGAAIAYGGDFRRNGYTHVLSQLSMGWNQTAHRPADLLHSYLAAQLDPGDGHDLVFTEHHLGRFGSAESSALLAPPAGPDLPPHRAALHFSDMRRVMEQHIHARVVIGGNALPRGPSPTGYGGRYPGVVEEAWRSLERGTPLYVVGGFGGAAALVADLLAGRDVPPRLCEAAWAQDETWAKLVHGLSQDPDVQRLGLPETQEAMAHAIQALGRPHLASDPAALAWNGLTREENELLFRTRDVLTITALVMRGLLHVRMRETAGKLHIELVRGDVTEARHLDVFAFSAFSDLELQGAGAALDRASGGGAGASRKTRGPVANRSDRVGTEFLYAADLGPVADVLPNPMDRIRQAAESTARMVLRHGFVRVGIVAFLGNCCEQVEAVVDPMLRGLRSLGDRAIVWFERDRARFEALRAILGIDDRVALTTREVAQQPALVAASSDRTYIPVRQRSREELEVALLVPRGNGLSPVHRTSLSDEERFAIVGDTYAEAPRGEDLNRRGRKLLELLFGASPDGILKPLRSTELVIVHDPPAAGLPYETLCWKDAESDEWVRPAAEAGIVRRLLADGIPIQNGLVRPPRTDLGVLLIVNPTDDLDGADREGEAVAAILRGLGIAYKVLHRQEATVEHVRAAIGDPMLDVLHYCGHAFFAGSGPDESGLNCADGPLTLRHMQGLPPAALPRLVFVNACQGGRVRGSRARAEPEAQAFAEFFLRGGVDAYLGAFWLVSDAGADIFARSVYAALGRGDELGSAVVSGRKALLQAQNADWANYVLYGHAGFRLVHPPA